MGQLSGTVLNIPVGTMTEEHRGRLEQAKQHSSS